MTLRQLSKQAGHADGSFNYLGWSVGPKTSSPKAAVEVSNLRHDGYSNESIRFDCWEDAKDYIDSVTAENASA